MLTSALATENGLAFSPTQPLYETTLNLREDLTLELWLKPAANNPVGARIADQPVLGGRSSFRLETGPGGTVCLVFPGDQVIATPPPAHRPLAPRRRRHQLASQRQQPARSRLRPSLH